MIPKSTRQAHPYTGWSTMNMADFTHEGIEAVVKSSQKLKEAKLAGIDVVLGIPPKVVFSIHMEFGD